MHYIIFLLGLLMYANVAEAIDCKTPPDCASLGYSKDNDPNCLDDGYMYCPFDFNFKKCVDKNCAALGFTLDDKSSWCDNLLTCETNSKYTACLSGKREMLTCEGFGLTSCPQNAICSECTEKSGKKFKLEACKCGFNQVGTSCNAASCPSGYETKYKSTTNCSPQGSGWEISYNGLSGTQKCGKCICTKTCLWKDANKGTASLSEPCCDGNYAKCTSSCPEVTVPEHARGTTQCTGCQKTVYTAWKCDTGYIESNGHCLWVTCEVGDVYYTDGSCGKAADYKENSYSKPVGVVYWVTTDKHHGKVVNLQDLRVNSSTKKFDPQKPYEGSVGFTWGNSQTTLMLLGCEYLENIANEERSESPWAGGKENTGHISDTLSNDLQYAAPAAKAFYPPEVSSTDQKFGAGNWYLPTLGEMMDLYGYNYKTLGNAYSSKRDVVCYDTTGAQGNNRETVNAALYTLSQKGVKAEALSTAYNNALYWLSHEWRSSSYRDHSYAWIFDMYKGQRAYTGKLNTARVRVSLEF